MVVEKVVVRMGCLVEREEEEGDVGGWSWCYCCWNGGGDGGENGGGVGGDEGWRGWPAKGRHGAAFWVLLLPFAVGEERRKMKGKERKMDVYIKEMF